MTSPADSVLSALCCGQRVSADTNLALRCGQCGASHRNLALRCGHCGAPAGNLALCCGQGGASHRNLALRCGHCGASDRNLAYAVLIRHKRVKSNSARRAIACYVPLSRDDGVLRNWSLFATFSRAVSRYMDAATISRAGMRSAALC